MLTTDQKGNIAEHAVVYHATKLGIDVYRPVGEGGRYDMLFDLDGRFVRVQCKWGKRYGDVIVVRCYSARRNRHGLVRRVYSPDEIDAFAVYCEATDRCYFLRCDQFGGRTHIQRRLVPSKNNQQEGINWAKDSEFAATLSRPKGP